MAATNVPVSVAGEALYAAIAADGANGNGYLNADGKARMLIHNPDATSLTAVVSVPATTDSLVDSLAVPDRTVAAFTDIFYLLPAYNPAIYNQTSGADIGEVIVTIAGTLTNVKCLAIK